MLALQRKSSRVKDKWWHSVQLDSVILWTMLGFAAYHADE